MPYLYAFKNSKIEEKFNNDRFPLNTDKIIRRFLFFKFSSISILVY